MTTVTRPAGIARRFAALLLTLSIPVTGGCAMIRDLENHPEPPLTDDEAITLIDSMRAKGSYEAGRVRLNDAAARIGQRISAAIPGQTWKFDDRPNSQEVMRGGAPCDRLTGDIALRPMADAVLFGRPFNAAEFGTAAQIVREEAAPFGATEESSLFNEDAKRDANIQGNNYQFEFGQIDLATLNITGECLLLQKVIDLPPGQLPPEPPIVPTTTP